MAGTVAIEKCGEEKYFGLIWRTMAMKALSVLFILFVDNCSKVEAR